MKPTWRYCFCLCHSQHPKSKQNHQITSSRAKTRSRRSQTCVKYRGVIICIKRNTDVNTSDLKKLKKKNVKISLFFHTLSSIYLNFNLVLGVNNTILSTAHCNWTLHSENCSLNCTRPCLNELQKEYCVKIKLIALDWQWVTLISWCQMNRDGHSFPVKH